MDSHPFWETCLQTARRILWGTQGWFLSQGLASLTAKPGQGGPLRLWSLCLELQHLPAEMRASGQLDLAELIFCFSIPSRLEIKWEVQFVNEPGTVNILAESKARCMLYVVIMVSPWWYHYGESMLAAWDRDFKRDVAISLNGGGRISMSICFIESWPVEPSMCLHAPWCPTLQTHVL